MKKFFFASVLLLTAISSWASNWDRAVEIFGKTSELKPYKMSTRSQTFNGKGQLEKTEEQTFLLDYSVDPDSPERELIMAIEDGIDITAERRKELEKGHSGGGPPPGADMEGMDLMPLDPAEQHRISPVFSGRTEYKNGIRCELWDFEAVLNDKYTGIGTAWINTETGAAVSIEYRIEPLFPFVEEMEIGVEFSADHADRWVLNKLTMNGKVNMLIMKRQFVAVTEFSDYR